MNRTIIYTDITFENGNSARITHVLSDDCLTTRVAGLNHVTKVKTERDVQTPQWTEKRIA